MPEPIRSWIKSLPSVAVGPVVIWLGLGTIAGIRHNGDTTFESVVGTFVLFAVFGLSVHLIAYAATGIPLFLYGYSRPSSRLWHPIGAVIIGAILGSIGFRIFDLMISDWDLARASKAPWGGCFYGVWTALCARRFKPKKSEQVAVEQPSISNSIS
jgi:hypothetical protein